jgi:hypothetical protein
MSHNIYQHVALVKQSFFQRLLRQHPQENAIIEVNNLLAAKPVAMISKMEIADIEQRHNLKLERTFRLNLEEFYAVYLNQCLSDRRLDDHELRDLKHLKSLFSLNDKTISYLHDQIGLLVYKASMQEAVADGRLTDDERSFLAQLEKELKLPAALAKKISEEVREQFFSDHLDNLINTADFSPSDEKELEAIAKSLNIDIDLNGRNKQQLKQLKTYWALENLPLTEYQSELPLQKGEICYFKIADVSWYELRGSQKFDVHARAITHKEFYLQELSKQKSVNNSVLRFVDKGTLYLTNKRILFDGQVKNSNIRLEGIESTTPYKNALHVLKEKGKSPVLQFAKKVDVFALILERLKREISN